MSAFAFIAGIVGAFVLASVLLIGGVKWVFNQMAFPGQIADIEQLRHDAAHVDPAQAEDVIGQVAEWNRTIAANRAQNKTWWAGWLVLDEWDSIEFIEVPR